MLSDSMESLPPAQLVQLLDLTSPAHWSPQDAAAALRQQLAAPLLPDLAAAPGAKLEQLETLAPSGATFQSTLLAPASIDLLHALKHWSRHLRTDSTTPLSPGPATVFYYAAIAAARLYFGKAITSLKTEAIREGFEWAHQQPGAEALCPLFEQAIATA